MRRRDVDAYDALKFVREMRAAADSEEVVYVRRSVEEADAMRLRAARVELEVRMERVRARHNEPAPASRSWTTGVAAWWSSRWRRAKSWLRR